MFPDRGYEKAHPGSSLPTQEEFAKHKLLLIITALDNENDRYVALLLEPVAEAGDTEFHRAGIIQTYLGRSWQECQEKAETRKI